MAGSIQTLLCVLYTAIGLCGAAEYLKNGDMESLDGWGQCWNFHCELVASGDSRLGAHSTKVSGRTQTWMGLSQGIHVTPGKTYNVQSWVKILNDKAGSIGQLMLLELSFAFSGNRNVNFAAAQKPLLRARDGWVLMQGDFTAPSEAFTSASFYYQGPEAGVDFMVDSASITDMNLDGNWRTDTDQAIDKNRKNNINVRATLASGIVASQVQIQVVQKKKSFPFGTAVSSWKYVEQTAPAQKYRDFLHQHFNWAVLENALKWQQLENVQGQYNYDRAVKTIDGLRSHGLKVRGHNMVWSIGGYVPGWVKSQSGAALRETVRKHIEWTCGITRGKLDHWDVNNENLHDHWFQSALHDYDYDLEIFRLMHQYCPDAKLFLNDYGVVGGGEMTKAYVDQGLRFKNAHVNLYGLGVQSHFAAGTEPKPYLIKHRLDMLAQVGVPLWATELTVEISDENTRADHYEKALRALYAHPSVEGILFWGFWDQAHYAGIKSALVAGDDLHLTTAGTRVLDLLEHQWMTDETHTLSGNQFTVRGFHGDYELHVKYQGRELTGLKQTFTLGKADTTVNVNVHV